VKGGDVNGPALALFGALLLGAPALAGDEAPAAEAVVLRPTADEIRQRLVDLGYEAAVVPGLDGQPYIRLTMSTLTVLCLFWESEGHVTSLQLYAAFSKPGRFKAKTINQWNTEKRFSRAYVDTDGDAVIEGDLDLEHGVTAGALDAFIKTFEVSVSYFSVHLGFYK
jgi:hypothetical protein